MMKILFTVLLFSILFSCCFCAPVLKYSQPAPGYHLFQSDPPVAGIVVEHYNREHPDWTPDLQIWIANADHPTSRTMLMNDTIWFNQVKVAPDGQPPGGQCQVR